MLICTCGEHNTPGDQICPGNCPAAEKQKMECSVSGHSVMHAPVPDLVQWPVQRFGSVLPGEECLTCGEVG